MMNFFLKIRLSVYFFIFLAVFLALVFVVPETSFTREALTLFSVNSFLYGFYIAPTLSAQKGRIEELSKVIRAEASALFGMLLATKKLPKETRNKLQDLFEDYMHVAYRQRRIAEGEKEYEELITYCLNYKGKDQDKIDEVLKGLVANQQNRSNLAMQMRSRVYHNEWWIMLILFFITLGFVLTLNTGNIIGVAIIKALLCTGLSMLMVNLFKLNTLSHKKALQIWHPIHRLLETRFYRID